MTSQTFRRILITALAAGASLCLAEFREFTSPYGQKMKFELVSHDGTGKTVTVRTEKGEVKKDIPLTAFSKGDQEFITEWTKTVAPKVDYQFKFEAKRNHLGGSAARSEWAYDVSVSNTSRTPVKGLMIRYQVHRGGEGRRDGVIEGEVPAEEELGLYEEKKFRTKAMETSGGETGRLGGIYVRLYDAHDQMVAEWRSEGVKNAEWYVDEYEEAAKKRAEEREARKMEYEEERELRRKELELRKLELEKRMKDLKEGKIPAEPVAPPFPSPAPAPDPDPEPEPEPAPKAPGFFD